MALNNENRFEIALCGDGGTGKTAIIRFLKQTAFERKYLETIGEVSTSLTFHTNYGEFLVNFREFAGQEKFKKFEDNTFESTDCFLLFFALNSKNSLKNLKYWSEVAKAHGGANKHAAVCGNKSDCACFRPTLQNDFYEVSAKTGAGVFEMITEILRNLSGHEDLTIN